MTDPVLYARSWALDDIEILRAGQGGSDGRTVTAYAAVFDSPTEIRDQQGHYMERIHPEAFKRQLGLGIERVKVFYNHGMTLHGTPSGDVSSVPIGVPVDIKADSRGLRTVTRFNDSPFADSILEAIRSGGIQGYSFRGRIFKSNPAKLPRQRAGAPLPTVTRTELGLFEYGPTPSPAYVDADIVAVRALLAGGITQEQLLRMLASTTPRLDEVQDKETPHDTPDPGPVDAADQSDGHSRRQLQLRLRAALRDRGL